MNWLRSPVLVNDHDFLSDASGVGISYCIYDQTHNRGTVCVARPAIDLFTPLHPWQSNSAVELYDPTESVKLFLRRPLLAAALRQIPAGEYFTILAGGNDPLAPWHAIGRPGTRGDEGGVRAARR